MHGTMQVMDQTGHTEVTWDSDSADEVRIARETFNTMVKDKKYNAFRVRKGGGQGERISEFDASAEKMLLIPHLVGG